MKKLWSYISWHCPIKYMEARLAVGRYSQSNPRVGNFIHQLPPQITMVSILTLKLFLYHQLRSSHIGSYHYNCVWHVNIYMLAICTYNVNEVYFKLFFALLLFFTHTCFTRLFKITTVFTQTFYISFYRHRDTRLEWPESDIVG